MRINFSDKEYEYLKSYFLIERDSLKLAFENSVVEIDENLADEIIDWAGERQQLKGFDEDYNLNEDGRLLDEIIDKLNH
jgi:hypothetical protein